MPGSFLTDDLAEFFSSDELADSATYNSTTFGVQFFDDYEAALNFGTEVESSNPFCIARDADITGIAHNSVITIKSVAYKVKEIQPDGTGLTILILSRD